MTGSFVQPALYSREHITNRQSMTSSFAGDKPYAMTTNINEKPGCLSIFLPFLGRSKKKPASETFPYRVRDDFLSPAEFSFYKVLSSLVGTRLTIQSKVRLADIFFVVQGEHQGKQF
jgi:hypothetical protein